MSSPQSNSIDASATSINILELYFADNAPLTPKNVPRAKLMIQELLADSQTMVDLLNNCFADAEAENKQDVADFVSGRLGQQNKYAWQLRSFLKDARD